MRPFKDFFVIKMDTSFFAYKFMFHALLLAAFLSITIAAESSDSTPAQVLAKQTGAAQFEEERYETHVDCDEHKHHLKKRASDEDVDYEVYQGVVGRPGIDFPIYPRIPKTSFSCRSFGNGYFADMETDCQVFHICEDGRKISFLCPNGTIFQQSELTCDWWFKVNCLGSPGYYADSAEILNKQRVQRIRPSVPVQGFNIVGGGLNIKPRVTNQVTRSRQSVKPERRFDSNEEPSLEAVDFEDISGEKQLKGEKSQIPPSIDNNNNNDETQVTAESGSFVDGRRRNSFGYDKPNVETAEEKSTEVRGRNNGRSSAYIDGRRGNSNNSEEDNKGGNGNGNRNGKANGIEKESGNDSGKRSGTRNGNSNSNGDISNERSTATSDGYNYPKGSTERTRERDAKRGQQRYREDSKSQPGSLESKEVNSESRELNKKSLLLDKQPSRQQNSSENRTKSRATSAKAESDPDEPRYSTRFVEPRLQSTTPYQSFGTYSTARRLDTTRSTPFYTPTVPTVAKSKTTEGKGFYIKGSPVIASNIVASTPNPNRFNIGTETSLVNRRRLNLQESASTPTATITTHRPIVIGMRYNHDSSSERQKATNSPWKSLLDTDLSTQRTRKRLDSASLITTTAIPATTGPTYLPRNSRRPNIVSNAGGDDFLSAPQPAIEGSDSVQRNVQEMIKTINMLKNKFDDVDQSKFQGQAREGLDIPPSSGPDALVSLAKYFEGEQNGKNSILNSFDNKSELSKETTSRGADATATTIVPGVSKKADDIRASLLSERRVHEYANLFGLEGKTTTDINLASRYDGLNTSCNDTADKVNLFPQVGTTGSTISELASKSDTRKIAQVFSEAITSYLEDPKTFRAQLASVRPTEPTVVSGKPNFQPITVTESPPATDAPATASSIAAEINNNFDLSTTSNEILSTTDFLETTTYRPRSGSSTRGKKLRQQLADELTPQIVDSNEHEEFLHGEHTQSFVMSRNNANSGKFSGVLIETNQKTTENPWNHISQTDFLDPLTINDGLMKEHSSTTTTQPNVKKEITTAKSHRSTARYIRVGSAEETTRHPLNTQHDSPEYDSWQELFHAYNLPQESLPSTNGLQRIANKLFGGLNESEALHLKNVMQQAEHNRQVLSLLLLLIQTCDDQNGRALERSRKHLLNALIDMDGKLAQSNDNGKIAHQKSDKALTVDAASVAVSPLESVVSSTTRTSETTLHQSATTNNPTTTDAITATAAVTTTTPVPGSTQPNGGIEETTKFEIRVEEPEESTTTISHGGSSASASSGNSSTNSDERALELLKSLYSLASKFTSRR